MRGRQSGFTLLELLVAMGIFVILGIALVQLVWRSFDFLNQGGQGGEVSDQLQGFERQFSEDLRSVFVLRRLAGVAPDVRMICRTIPWKLETEEAGSGRGTTRRTIDLEVPVLGFVRTIQGEEKDRLTRLAGSTPGGDAYLDMNDDEREAREGKLKPLGGLMEVLYVAVPKEGSDGSIWSVYRAKRSPIGGTGSLLDLSTLKSAEDLKRINAQQILAGVLFLDFRFWGTDTTSWDDRLAPGPGGGGPYRCWDSTRGLLAAGGADGFPLAAGADSLDDASDDVFPRRVRARLVLVPVGRGARFARLVEALGDREEDRTCVIDPPTLVPGGVGSADRFLKVGAEWIEWSTRNAGEFRVAARGLRETVRTPHPAGTTVYYGQTWEVGVGIPAFREDILK